MFDWVLNTPLTVNLLKNNFLTIMDKIFVGYFAF